jgi:amidase
MIGAPTESELRRIAERNFFALSDEEVRVFSASIEKTLASFSVIADLDEPTLPGNGGRGPGRRPTKQENPHRAWAWLTSIKGTRPGALSGKRIAIKDNVAVAGFPMNNGSSLLDGYVADVDATVVTRIIEAGGEIAGKAVSEHLCFSGGSHTSDSGPVLNPRSSAYMAGGSSSGSAALLAAGACDLAIGGDQGGSIRIPSAWCGVFGLKPTWGLVPYTGAFPIEPSLDHLGPMANSVENIALLLDVIAGRDGLDPRQIDTPFALPSYKGALARKPRPLRIGVLREGFGIAGVSDPDVDALVRGAAEKFAVADTKVTEVSVPMHSLGLDIWTGIATEGAWSVMVRDNSAGHGLQGHYNGHLTKFYAQSRREHGNNLSPTVKSVILLGDFLSENYHGSFYVKAQNLRRSLRAAYDEALTQCDVLLMPTTPRKPTRHIENPSLDQTLGVALDMMGNTATFDATGHPAISLPCGSINELPIGMMLVGRRFEEASVLAAAYQFEQAGYTSLAAS